MYGKDALLGNPGGTGFRCSGAFRVQSDDDGISKALPEAWGGTELDTEVTGPGSHNRAAARIEHGEAEIEIRSENLTVICRFCQKLF